MNISDMTKLKILGQRVLVKVINNQSRGVDLFVVPAGNKNDYCEVVLVGNTKKTKKDDKEDSENEDFSHIKVGSHIFCDPTAMKRLGADINGQAFYIVDMSDIYIVDLNESHGKTGDR